MTTEQQLDQLIAALPKELPMPADDWQSLAARLANTPQQAVSAFETSPPVAAPNLETLSKVSTHSVPVQRAANTTGFWLAASIAAGVVLASVLMRSPDIEQSTAAAHVVTPVVTPVAPQDATVLVMQLKQQRTQLLARISQQQLRQLQQVPVGFENWRQQLAIWQKASIQLEQALLQQPANRRLLRQYQQLQQQQFKYMHTLTSLSQAYS